jgi:hypothetical protein
MKEGGAVKKTQRSWTPEQDAYLAIHYTSTPVPELARALGHTVLAVHRRGRFLGLLRARTLATQAIRHDYFATLDTPKKAYILGLLASDGNVSSDQPRVRLTLHAKDGALVEIVRDELAPHSPLHRRRGAVHFGVSSLQLVADLARYGIVPRKSYCLEWPDVLPPTLHWAFLLGYFDGDGSLSVTRRSVTASMSFEWILYGLPGFLSSAGKVIEAHTGVCVSGPTPDRRKATLHRIRVYGDNARLVDTWLHQGGQGLARKRIPV